MAAIIRNAERGIALIDVLVALAISAMFIATCWIGLTHKPYERQSAIASFASALDRAHGLAQSSGNGATLIKFPNSTVNIGFPGYTYVLCAGRPFAGTNFARCQQLDTEQGDIVASAVGNETWALYVDSRGSVAVGPWQSSYAQTMAGAPQDLATEPACPAGTTISFQITGGEATTTQTVDCSSGTLQ